jgi:hypothetical protein
VVSTNVLIPSDAPIGSFDLVVVANGIASDPRPIRINDPARPAPLAAAPPPAAAQSLSQRVLAPFQGWVPGVGAAILLALWIVSALAWVFVIVPAWASSVKETNCYAPPNYAQLPQVATLGAPDSASTLTPALSIARGVARSSVAWAAGSGASGNGDYQAFSSELIQSGTGTTFPASNIKTWLSVSNGSAILNVCLNSSGVHLTDGTYAGYAGVPVSHAGQVLTVREQLQVQATYTGDFWPLGLLFAALGMALVWSKLNSSSWVFRWIIFATGVGAFSAAYFGLALSDPSWGGLRAVGSLIAGSFAATAGAIATLAAKQGT